MRAANSWMKTRLVDATRMMTLLPHLKRSGRLGGKGQVAHQNDMDRGSCPYHLYRGIPNAKLRCTEAIFNYMCRDTFVFQMFLSINEDQRPDHSLQDVRSKIFPFKRRKVNAPEVIPTITLPVRRKERSLSSLVVNTPRVATQSGLTGRRTKVTTRRASTLRGLSPLIDEPIKKEGNNVEDRIENSSSPETLAKMTQNKRQSSSNAEPSNHTSNKDLENGGESFFDKVELWKPLNCLVEAANRTRGLKSGPPSPSIKAEQSNDPDNEGDLHKGKIWEHPNKLKVQDDKNYDGSSHMPQVVVRRRRRKRRDLGTSTQALIDAARATRERRTSPIWLSLVPSFDPQRDLTPPQNSACYLRIKDGNLPVSFIQKYLAKKFNLSSEAEVDIECQGQPVSPALPLHSLADIWQRHRPSQRAQASLGASAKDFVMVLHYNCKALAP